MIADRNIEKGVIEEYDGHRVHLKHSTHQNVG